MEDMGLSEDMWVEPVHGKWHHHRAGAAWLRRAFRPEIVREFAVKDW